MTNSPVRITNAHKYYNKGKSNQLHVMDNVNLELPEQGLVAIFGRSGCGKTTLLNTVGGLDKIASGSIELFGQNIKEDTDTLRNKYVGYIFQNYNLSLTDTVYENVAAALRLCGLTDETDISERVMAALGNVDMAKYRDRTPDTLSGGQQQRVAIARAIVKCPAIILADEPTGNLDEANTVLVMDILKELSRTRLVLLVTHEAHLVDHYCDRVIEIVDGRVTSDRTNQEANGYVTRNKNHIYLGELEKTETAAPGVSLEYYGEPMGEIRLRIVNQGGKLFLKAEGAPVKILDEGSEIQLMEGVFDEAPAELATAHGRTLDMSRLTPVEGTSYGRLYHWRNAIASAWRENFGKKHKKGKKLLRACLFMLAVALVFMTATFGAGIGAFMDMRKDHNENAFYIPLEPDTDYGFLRNDMGNHGMEYARITGGDPLYDKEFLIFSSAAFMTAETVRLQGEAVLQDMRHAASLPVVAGTGTPESDSDILITTALADKLLETSTVGYLDDYADLVGLVSSGYFDGMGNSRLRIAGVVESDELNAYLESFMLSRHLMERYLYLPVTYASHMNLNVAEGQVVYIDEGITSVDNNVGAKVTINGLDLTVGQVIHRYGGMENYPDYVKDTYGEYLILTPEEYAKTLPEGTDPEAAYWEWLLDHYFKYLPAFLEYRLSMAQPYEDIGFEEWAVAKKGSVAAYINFMGQDPYIGCAAYLYQQENGVYPTSNELNAYADANSSRIKTMMNEDDRYRKEFDRFMEQHWNGNYKETYYYVVSDADYMKLVSGAGLCENVVMESPFYVWDYGDGDPYYTHSLMISSSDPAATAAYLAEKLGNDGFFSPEDIFEKVYAEIRESVAITVITVAAVIALMCLCVFFIMRSSFMSRVREVGILRAIGVTKKNLTFRFAVEAALLLLLTVVPGYGLSFWFIGSLHDAPLVSEIFYFPLWLGLGLFIILAAVTLVFGVLPARALLRKTPSEILSKYDI